MKTKNLIYFTPALFLGAVLTGLALSSHFMTPVSADPIDATLVGSSTIALASPEDVKIKLSPSTSLYGSDSHHLTFNTNAPDGYKITISSKTASTDLTSETTEDKIAATRGTFENPTVLEENTWGYALAGTGSFDESYAETSLGSKWAGVTTSPVAIVDSSVPSYENTTLDVYYAANVSKYVEAGTYKNTVVYTLTAKTDVATIPAPTIESFSPGAGVVTGGTEITIVGESYTKNGNSITTEVLIGDKACTDVVITANSPVDGKDTIVCKAPVGYDGTDVKVTVKTWGGEAEATDTFHYANSTIIHVTPDIATTNIETGSKGASFTIGGEGFQTKTVASVLIGAEACPNYQVLSDTQITCIDGPTDNLSVGPKNVQVIFTDNTRAYNDNVIVAYSDENYPIMTAANLATYCVADQKTIMKDARDNQLYYVRRLADGKCWMVDNLKYADDTMELAQEKGKALTKDGTRYDSTDSTNFDVAKFVDPDGIKYCWGVNNISIPSETVTHCGFLYNWYTATAGTGTSDLVGDGYNATGSICPAGFRLPSARSDGTTATSNGTSFAVADFPVLNASMKNGTLSAGSLDSTTRANYLPDSTWNGIWSGYWGQNGFSLNTAAAVTMYYWSSTTSPYRSPAGPQLRRAYNLSVNNRQVGLDAGADNDRSWGFAVRCVEDN